MPHAPVGRDKRVLLAAGGEFLGSRCDGNEILFFIPQLPSGVGEDGCTRVHCGMGIGMELTTCTQCSTGTMIRETDSGWERSGKS